MSLPHQGTDGVPPAATDCDPRTFHIGQIRVESLAPSVVRKNLMPIILLHGDYHPGSMWLTKPDGRPGWAAFFAERGHRVYAPQLPFHGQSADSNYNDRVKAMTPQQVENLFTAVNKINDPEWPAAKTHTQWPGSGIRGDPIFERYFNQLIPMHMDSCERQAAAQEAVESLLRFLKRPAILIGHGSGANVAWLAADVARDFVHAIVAVEPLGPPFGSALETKNGKMGPTSNFRKLNGTRQYGLADIPIQFAPPVAAPESFEELLDEKTAPYQPIQVTKFYAKGRQGKFCFEQVPVGLPPAAAEPRKLPNLVGIPQLVITAEASFHRVFDWATVHFLRQAGATVKYHKLEQHGIHGNGHLCFLEENSNSVANHVLNWLHEEASVPKAKIVEAPRSHSQAISAPGSHGHSSNPLAGRPSSLGDPISATGQVRTGDGHNPPSVSAPQSLVVRNAQVVRGVDTVPFTPHNKPIRRTGQTTISERRLVEVTTSPDSPTPRPATDLDRRARSALSKLSTVREDN
ncbi:Alpha/Beta hydrolase protein [Sordaria brevicollis]|uniref:Alpha/Beta hydrolase protein n=1 Tax=Sordaria brevicollis TaxID=83679 RepID=A0AAE0P177_SORBR|nr:Alpha/Beta hydrolase protein [Sordaria brevicollis]